MYYIFCSILRSSFTLLVIIITYVIVKSTFNGILILILIHLINFVQSAKIILEYPKCNDGANSPVLR